jgi:hypothetical protein
LEASDLVEVKECDLVNKGDIPNPDQFPLDLKRYIGWYPTFCLFPRLSWEASFSNPLIPLQGSIFNGMFTPGNPLPQQNNNIPPDEENLLNWIKHELATPSFADSARNSAIKPLISGAPSKKVKTKTCNADSHEICKKGFVPRPR